MSLLTASEVTNFFLYGTKTKPTDFVDDRLIRPNPLPGTNYYEDDISAVEYMSTGAGRFALASMSSV